MALQLGRNQNSSVRHHLGKIGDNSLGLSDDLQLAFSLFFLDLLHLLAGHLLRRAVVEGDGVDVFVEVRRRFLGVVGELG